jgi:hypothetical protein
MGTGITETPETATETPVSDVSGLVRFPDVLYARSTMPSRPKAAEMHAEGSGL